MGFSMPRSINEYEDGFQRLEHLMISSLIVVSNRSITGPLYLSLISQHLSTT
ncbi:hypothetical protein ACSBR1_021260 [Camellia fascicularis]